MQLLSGSHLSFCTNIFPGESWGELAQSLRSYVPEIKRRVSPERAFGLGLRLSAQAARDLRQEAAFEQLCDVLEELGAYVFSINGFPYGAFHGTRIKEGVYDPDWRTDERLVYTLELAELLARLHTRGHTRSAALSISTVPGCYRYGRSVDAPQQLIARQLARAAMALSRIYDRTGALITLGLEPEPACLIETTQEAIAFLQDHLFSQSANLLRGLVHNDRPSQPLEHLLRRHVGVCLDACHAAVQFEDPVATVRSLRKTGILVAKLQITAGLVVPCATPEALQHLRAFDDGHYLHQGTVALAEGLERFVDLPDAFARNDWSGSPWRVHFHVPVFLKDFGALQSTQDDLRLILEEQRREPFSEHLEVETYTFSVLPQRYRPSTPGEGIAQELEWTLHQLQP